MSYTSMNNIITKAANLATGKRYKRLLEICENQKTISTRKLERLLDVLMEGDRPHAIYLKKLSDERKVYHQHQKLYIIVDDQSGEEAINHDGTPAKFNGENVILEDCWGEGCTTAVEKLGEDRFYLEEV